MPDILGREQVGQLVGTFSADRVTLFFNNGDESVNFKGTAAQSISVQYQSPVQTIFELGSADRYHVVGRAAGQASIGQILGPSLLTYTFLERLGDPCSAGDRTILFNVGVCRPNGFTGTAAPPTPLKMNGCISTGLSLNTEAQNVLIQQQVSVQFASLSRQGAAA